MSRRLYLGTAVLLCVAAAAGIVALVVADPFLVEINLAYTAGSLLVFGVVAVAALSVTGMFAWIGWLAAAAAVAGFGFLMGALWSADEFGDSSETLYKLTGCFSMFSFALAYAALVLNGLRPGGNRFARGLVPFALVAALAIATLLSVAIVGEISDATYFRVAAVVAVLWALAGALIPIARGLRRTA
jgi:hypothetical protein